MIARGHVALSKLRKSLPHPEKVCRFTQEPCREAENCKFSMAFAYTHNEGCVPAMSAADVCEVAIQVGIAHCRACAIGKRGDCRFPASCWVKKNRKKRPIA